MVVDLKKNQLDWFRRRARNSSHEIYALLIGKRVSPTKVTICQFRYPRIKDSSPYFVSPDEDDLVAMEVEAKEDGLVVLGTIHTHPNYLPVMSSTDVISHVGWNHIVSGIVEVTNRKTRVAFWTHDSCLPCDFFYY